MDIKEIVNRPYNVPISQDESLYLIEQYVKDKKGVDVNIHILMNPFTIERHTKLMLKALPYAIAHFKQN